MPEQKFTGDVDDLWDKLQTGEYVVVRRDTMRQIERRLAIVSPTDTDAIAIESALTRLEQRISRRGLLINLGSGQRPFDPPWINVDKQEKWNPDVVADGANLKDHFKDESASMIVLHHCLEHFGCGEADGMLKECHRILKPGGSLIVCVPDMVALANAWMSSPGDRDYVPGFTTQIYMTNVYGAYHGDESDRHKWGFDRESLEGTLRKAGFGCVSSFNWRPIAGASIANDWWILAAEATK